MLGRVIPADFTVDRTLKRKRSPAFVAVLVFLVLIAAAFLCVGCGEPDVHVSQQGLVVIDPAHLVDADTLDQIINRVIDVGPAADRLKVRPALEAVTLTLVDAQWVHCDGADDGDAIGCTEGDNVSVAASGHSVWDGDQVAGIIAHEIGHVIGHGGHDYVPWFGTDGEGHTGMERTIDQWWTQRYIAGGDDIGGPSYQSVRDSGVIP